MPQGSVRPSTPGSSPGSSPTASTSVTPSSPSRLVARRAVRGLCLLGQLPSLFLPSPRSSWGRARDRETGHAPTACRGCRDRETGIPLCFCFRRFKGLQAIAESGRQRCLPGGGSSASPTSQGGVSVGRGLTLTLHHTARPPHRWVPDPTSTRRWRGRRWGGDLATLIILLSLWGTRPGASCPQLMWDRQQHKLPWPPEGCAQACCCRRPTRRPGGVGILARAPKRGAPSAHDRAGKTPAQG